VLAIVLMMTVIVLLAAGVVLYVAFGHRDEDGPRTAWLGDAMSRAVESLPTLEESDQLRR
jgi:heme/copper-type cytochrome/quinol oxidase subunit 2